MAYIEKFAKMVEAEDDKDGMLTCGVELEFLVPSIQIGTEDPDPDITDLRLFRTSGNVQQMEYEVRMETLQQSIGHQSFRDMDYDQLHGSGTNVLDYTIWRLGCDVSVTKSSDPERDVGPYDWTGCELTSPVMKSDDYIEQFQEVCEVLKTLRVHINGSAGVHVHVGLGNEPFSLLTLKKFATLYLWTEKAFLELQHPSRRSNAHCHRLADYSQVTNKSQALLRDEGPRWNTTFRVFALMTEYLPLDDLSNLQYNQVNYIWYCNNMEEVATLMQGEVRPTFFSVPLFDRGSVGFERFLPAGPAGMAGGNIQTFEWRQMSGSIDADHISQWVNVCLKFTDFCRLSDKDTFRNLVQKVIKKGKDYTGIELLEDLGIDTRFFKRKIEEWKRDSSFCEDNQGRKLFAPK
ncbi:putative amidoligase enzyme-domain-containing protein [Nemania diffusa]|nr:putative amidoligase enzyme-domain-containing protein [Nemania diffusa]